MMMEITATGSVNYAGIATLITAIASAFVTVYGVIHVKKVEKIQAMQGTQLDKADEVQDKTHAAVNSNMTAAVKEIADGKEEIRKGAAELKAVKEATIQEIKDQLKTQEVRIAELVATLVAPAKTRGRKS